jgi:hypothetical protein
MKASFLAYRDTVQTVSGLSDGEGPVKIVQTPSGQSGAAIGIEAMAARFKLPWSHDVRLLSVRNLQARHFYEEEAIRGGWTIRRKVDQTRRRLEARTSPPGECAWRLSRGKREIHQVSDSGSRPEGAEEAEDR